MDLREIGWGSVEWIQLVQDRDWWRALVSTVMNLQVLAPQSCFSCVENVFLAIILIEGNVFSK
jgi:hypothetical protein